MNGVAAQQRPIMCEAATARAGVQGAVIVVIALALHAASAQFDFVYDDLEIIVENEQLREQGSVSRFFLAPFWSFEQEERGTRNYYRPLLLSLHWVQYRLFGLKPAGYHLTNILVHGVASLLVFLLARRALGSTDRSGWGAFAGAAVFAVHPVHVEAVCWVSGIADVLASCLVLLSLHVHARQPERLSSGILAAGMSFLGSLVKETAFVLPALVVAWDFSVGARPTTIRMAARRYAPLAAACAAGIVARALALGGLVPDGAGGWWALLSAPWLLARYLGLLFFPTDLNVMHAFSAVHGAEARFFIGVALAGGLAAAGLFAWRRAPVLSLGIVLFAIPILPVLNASFLTRHPFAERYLYLPSVALSVVVGWVVARAWNASRGARTLSYLGAAVILVALAVLSSERMAVWRDEISLWSRTVADVPSDPIAQYNLGRALLKAGMVAEAVEHLEAAVEMAPRNVNARNNLGVAYVHLGRLREAVGQFEQAVQLRPADVGMRVNLGRALVRSGLAERALEECGKAAEISPANRAATRCIAEAAAAVGRGK